MTDQLPTEIYILEPVVDDPRLEGFGLGEQPSLLGRKNRREDIKAGYEASESNRCWTQTRLMDVWVPPRVVGRVASYNDYPGISLLYPAFSQRAADALRDFLDPNGELLPLDSDVGIPYYFYNITTIVNALDSEKSDCFWLDSAIIGDISHFIFYQERLKGLSIFRVYEWPVRVFVTGDFVRRVDECGLNGFEFIKVWPFKKGVNWRKAGRRKIKQQRATKKLKQNTLVLIFPLEGKRPSAAEKKTIKRFEDELDAQLVVRSLNAPYFGSLEGNDKVEGEMRLFLSCPDVDHLVEKLQPWLEQLDWPRTCHVMKRYGEMYDVNAEESVIDIG